MKRFMILGLVASLATVLLSQTAAFGGEERIDVCRSKNLAGWQPISVKEGRAVQAHLDHSAALPGDPVPGMPGYSFNDDCVAIPDHHLRLLQWQAPSLANPYLATGTTDLLASSLVLEPLAEFGPDGTLVPALAADIPTQANGGISSDMTQVTWTLRNDVVWSDGSSFTASDVVFSWEYCTDGLTGCSNAFAFQDVVSVVARDPHAITVTFNGPVFYPFDPFVGYGSPIIQREQFQDCVGAAAAGCTAENLMPVGTGPFIITDFSPPTGFGDGSTVLYEYNPNYRHVADGKPFFGTVELRGDGNAEAAARAVLETGSADYAWNLQLDPGLLEDLEALGNGTLTTGFATAVAHINLNQTNPDGVPPSGYNGGANPHPYFFENEVLHDALSMAIDRDEIVQAGYGAFGEPTCNMWNVGAQTSTNNDWCLVQDIAGAIALLDANGYLDTDDDGVRETPGGLPLEFDFVTSTNVVRQGTQTLIEGYWEQIGVAVNMMDLPPNIFFNPFSGNSIWDFLSDMNMFTNGARTPDALGYLAGWTVPQIPDPTVGHFGGNIVRLASPAYDALHAQLSTIPFGDPSRDPLVIELNDIIVDYSTIPLVHRGSVSAFGNSIAVHGDLNAWDSEYWNIEDWVRTE